MAACFLGPAQVTQSIDVSYVSPADGTWWPNASGFVTGNASGASIDARTLDSVADFANGSFENTALNSSGFITLDSPNRTFARFFEDFSYGAGTPVVSTSLSWVSGDTGWITTSNLTSLLSGPPSAAYRQPSGNSHVDWRVVSHSPIREAHLSFRYAMESSSIFTVYLAPDGQLGSGAGVQLFQAMGPQAESLAEVEFSANLSGQGSFYILFYYAGGGSGNGWLVFDDLLIELGYDPAGSPQAEFLEDHLSQNQNRPWVSEGGSWSIGDLGLSGGGRSLNHDGAAANATYRLWAAATVVSVAAAFRYTCEANGTLSFYVGSGIGSATVLFLASQGGANNSSFAGNISNAAGKDGFLLRWSSTGAGQSGRCSIDDLNLSIELDLRPTGYLRGEYEGPPLDSGILVNWTNITFSALAPPNATVRVDVRDSTNQSTWTAWRTVESGESLNPGPSRYMAFRFLLRGFSADGYPGAGALTFRFYAFSSVSASTDNGSTWTPLGFSTSVIPNAIDWAGNVTLGTDSTFVRVRAGDTTGAFDETARRIRWDIFPPSAPGTPLDDGAAVNRTRLTWTWAPATDLGLGVEEYRVRVGSMESSGEVAMDISTGASASFTLLGAANGSVYYLSVQARDAAGLWGAWSNSSDGILVDLSGPLAEKPNSPKAWVNTTWIQWFWNATADSGSPIVAYGIRVGSVAGAGDILSGIEVAGLDYTYSDAAEGPSYYLAVRALDLAGNYGPWGLPSEPVRIDMTAPGAPPTFTGPAGYQAVDSATWDWESAVDAGAGIDHYDFCAGTYERAEDISACAATGSTTISLQSLPDGTEVFAQVRSVDRAGNPSNWSYALVLRIDRSPPGPPSLIAEPRDWEDHRDVNWSWASSVDGFSGIAGYLVRVGSTPGGQQVVREVLVAAPAFTTVFPAEAQPFYVGIGAMDLAGNLGPQLIGGPYRVDMTPPTIPGDVDGPDAFSSNTTVVWSWASSIDAGAGMDHYEVRLGSSDGAGDVLSWRPVFLTTFEFSTPLNGHVYFFAVRAVDRVGWVSFERRSNQAVQMDFDPPGEVVVGVLQPFVGTASVAVRWMGVSDDGPSGVAGYEVETANSEGTRTIVVGRDTLSFELYGLDGASYQIRVRAVDRAANGGGWSSTQNVTFDRTPPSPPTLITAQQNGTHIRWWWFPSQDNGSGLAGYRVDIGTGPKVFDVVDGFWALEPGIETQAETGQTFFIRVTAVDRAGNTAQSIGPSDGVLVAPLTSPATSEQIAAPVVLVFSMLLVATLLVLNRMRRKGTI